MNKVTNGTHKPVPFICMKCAHVHNVLICDYDEARQNPVPCAKCGRTSRLFSLGGIFEIVRDIIQEQERLREGIFDLEIFAEETITASTLEKTGGDADDH